MQAQARSSGQPRANSAQLLLRSLSPVGAGGASSGQGRQILLSLTSCTRRPLLWCPDSKPVLKFHCCWCLDPGPRQA